MELLHEQVEQSVSELYPQEGKNKINKKHVQISERTATLSPTAKE